MTIRMYVLSSLAVMATAAVQTALIVLAATS